MTSSCKEEENRGVSSGRNRIRLNSNLAYLVHYMSRIQLSSFFYLVNRILAGLWWNCISISSDEITFFLLAGKGAGVSDGGGWVVYGLIVVRFTINQVVRGLASKIVEKQQARGGVRDKKFLEFKYPRGVYWKQTRSIFSTSDTSASR